MTKRVALAAVLVTALSGSACGGGHHAAALQSTPAGHSQASTASSTTATTRPSHHARSRTTAPRYPAPPKPVLKNGQKLGAYGQILDPLAPAAHPPKDPIATGKTQAGSTWQLWGWVEDGRICLKDETTQVDGSGGGGSGCGHQLPIAYPESTGGPDRLIDGIVTPAATRVALERVDGSMVDLPIVARPADIPAAYYLHSVDLASRYDYAIAYDGGGRELGRRYISPEIEDQAIKAQENPGHK